ncbi:MAG TPA: (2Fe-2S)-binding protein [Verrucomicrobiae bacterium]|jgi:aerobic-type carbon monoxide dehydrogenase small subunit (CoxS/CutS family)|nr:(2Fe-2S)-binding protein [Verrucomicrobiae bacterium]
MSESSSKDGFSVSRRAFLKTFGTSAAVAATAQVDAVAAELEKANQEKIVGPEAVPITLKVNGKTIKLQVEPRVTLLDALRNMTPLTGTKEVCDRATCGACSMLVDEKLVYSCSMLAIEAQGKKITTVEGLGEPGKLSKVQEAFVEQDALMCGYCTPGFVMSVTALLKQHPKPTEAQVRHACSGNLCRCGTYPRILEAALKAAGVAKISKTEVIAYADVA